jgi:hypothetical protein
MNLHFNRYSIMVSIKYLFFLTSPQDIQLWAADLFVDLLLPIMCQLRENCICYLPYVNPKKIKYEGK